MEMYRDKSSVFEYLFGYLVFVVFFGNDEDILEGVGLLLESEKDNFGFYCI